MTGRIRLKRETKKKWQGAEVAEHHSGLDLTLDFN